MTFVGVQATRASAAIAPSTPRRYPYTVPQLVAPLPIETSPGWVALSFVAGFCIASARPQRSIARCARGCNIPLLRRTGLVAGIVGGSCEAKAGEDFGLPERLDTKDLAAMEQLIHGLGVKWQQTKRDLQRLVEEHSVLGIRGPDGLVSMGALRKWSASKVGWGWLSFICTAPAARRRGLARRLVTALLDGSGSIPIGLYGGGTALSLYRSLGFEVRGEARLLRRQEGFVPALDSSLERPERLAPDSPRFDAVVERDREIYGGNRRADLCAWIQEPGFGFSLSSGAYVFGRARYPDGIWLGPLVAESSTDAEILLAEALRAAPKGPVEMIEPAGVPSVLAAVASGLGFSAFGITNLMVRGSDVPPSMSHRGLGPVVASGFEYG